MSTRPLFNDWYAPDHNLGYLDGLGTWCGRIGIPVIKFELNKIYCDEGGRSIQKWEAIPKCESRALLFYEMRTDTFKSPECMAIHFYWTIANDVPAVG